MFGRSKKSRFDHIALTVLRQGRRHDVTVAELALGNKLSLDALLAVLVDKGLVEPAELQTKIQQLSQQSWRTRSQFTAPATADVPAAGSGDADPSSPESDKVKP